MIAAKVKPMKGTRPRGVGAVLVMPMIALVSR